MGFDDDMIAAALRARAEAESAEKERQAVEQGRSEVRVAHIHRASALALDRWCSQLAIPRSELREIRREIKRRRREGDWDRPALEILTAILTWKFSGHSFEGRVTHTYENTNSSYQKGWTEVARRNWDGTNPTFTVTCRIYGSDDPRAAFTVESRESIGEAILRLREAGITGPENR